MTSKYKTIWVKPETHANFRAKARSTGRTADSLIQCMLAYRTSDALAKARKFNRRHGYLSTPSVLTYHGAWYARPCPTEPYALAPFEYMVSLALDFIGHCDDAGVTYLDILTLAAGQWDAKEIVLGCDLRDPCGPARNTDSVEPHWFRIETK